MSIKVVYNNGKKGRVTSGMLDYLLETERVISFKRRDGWVRPGCDRIRTRDRFVFSIPERRSSVKVILEANSHFPGMNGTNS